jgi:hypothetical protein
VTVTVCGGTVWVTVDAVVVTITVRVGDDSVWVGVDSVCVVVVVGVGDEVESVGVARVAVRVATAALLPPPHEVRTTEATTPIAATARSLAATAA